MKCELKIYNELGIYHRHLLEKHSLNSNEDNSLNKLVDLNSLIKYIENDAYQDLGLDGLNYKKLYELLLKLNEEEKKNEHK